MGNTIVKSVINLKSHEMMGIETGNIFNMSSRHELVKVEYDFIRRLSKKMFDDEDAYNHESLLSMESHFEKSIEKIENQTKKSYIVRS